MFLNPFYSSKLIRIAWVMGLILLQFNYVYSQQSNDASLFYNWFDERIGIENSGLYNGSIYTDNFHVVNDKHQFFNSPSLSSGSVTYDGQTYYDQKIKYDLFNDILVITPKNKNSALLVILEITKTEGFSIDERSFIRIKNSPKESSKALGFYELISKNDSSQIVKKYRKEKIEKRESRKVYQEFEENINYFVIRNNMFYPVDSRREWILAFPGYKKAIKDYYKNYSALRKTDMDTFMKFALEHLYSLQQDQNNFF